MVGRDPTGSDLGRPMTSTYLGRRFLAIDGESIGDRYVLLMDSTGRHIENWDGYLSTVAVLAFLTRDLPHNASWTRVMYGSGFDVHHWLRDVPAPDRLALMHDETVRYEGYGLRWIEGKILEIDPPDPKAPNVTLYDCFSLFGEPFARVVEQWLPDDPLARDIIRAGKEARTDLGRWEREQVEAYCLEECKALAAILERVRAEVLVPAGLDIRSWYGTGAVTSRVLDHSRVYRQYKRHTPEKTAEGLWHAFSTAHYGGRIDLLQVGTVGPVYRYDLRSAYAWACAHLGQLDFEWFHVDRFDASEKAKLSVWHVTWDVGSDENVGPFPCRWNPTKDSIIYPAAGEGWYYWPEVVAAKRTWGRRIRVSEGYVCYRGQHPTTLRPEVRRLYLFRKSLEAEGHPGAEILKRVLAAIWGKFAQHYGRGGGVGRFYCLPYAGWVCSLIRARLLEAVRGEHGSVVAFTADGVVTTSPLPGVQVGTGLGAWRVDTFDRGTFILPGFCRLFSEEAGSKKEEIIKHRGFARADIIWDSLIARLNQHKRTAILTRRFVGHGLADAYPDRFGGHRLGWVRMPLVVDPAVHARSHGGAAQLLRADFRFDRDSVRLSLPPGPHVSHPAPLPEVWTLKVKRAQYVGEEAAEADRTRSVELGDPGDSAGDIIAENDDDD